MKPRRRHPNQRRLLSLLLKLDEIGSDVEHFVVSPEASRNHDAVEKLAKRPSELLEQFQKTIVASLGVAKLAAEGFAARSKNTAPIMPANKLERWMHQIDPHDALTFQLRAFVTVTCAELERFLRELARWHLTGKQLKRIRAERDRPQHLARGDSKARSQLTAHVCPSLGTPSEWPRRLRLVFGFKPPKSLTDSLRILIQWRHEFSHRNCPPLTLDWNGEPDAIESIITWCVACIALSEFVAVRARRAG